MDLKGDDKWLQKVLEVAAQTSLARILLNISGAYKLQSWRSFMFESISTTLTPTEASSFSEISLSSAQIQQKICNNR